MLSLQLALLQAAPPCSCCQPVIKLLLDFRGAFALPLRRLQQELDRLAAGRIARTVYKQQCQALYGLQFIFGSFQSCVVLGNITYRTVHQECQTFCWVRAWQHTVIKYHAELDGTSTQCSTYFSACEFLPTKHAQVKSCHTFTYATITGMCWIQASLT